MFNHASVRLESEGGLGKGRPRFRDPNGQFNARLSGRAGRPANPSMLYHAVCGCRPAGRPASAN
eukprot:4487267-Lingulodinium_polyedra.AAC.1